MREEKHPAVYIIANKRAHFRDCIALFADEAFWAGDKSGEGQLQAFGSHELSHIANMNLQGVLRKLYAYGSIASGSLRRMMERSADGMCSKSVSRSSRLCSSGRVRRS